ncbi:MAG TPA: penicillin acylase family protein [Polyangiaceae bacterium]|nr:penicillin acylase family protein [Polyangiaceae bacterium]
MRPEPKPPLAPPAPVGDTGTPPAGRPTVPARPARRRAGRALALGGALLALGALGAGGGVLWLRRSLPALAGSIAAPGLGARVEVVRDREAIPHVYAQSEADAYYGLGVVHAQDRSWQLELMRRAASGRLAELFGAEALGEDRLMRTLGLRRAAERSLPSLDAEVRAVLSSYADGINAALAATVVLPPELVLLGGRPEPWTELDALVGIRLLAWQLSVQFGRELLRARLLDRLSPAQIASLVGGSADAIETGRSQLGLRETERSRYSSIETNRSPMGNGSAVLTPGAPVPGPELAPFAPAWGALERFARAAGSAGSSALGSNSWAVSGARSASGKPLLANDPHLELSMPAVWYLAHLAAPGLNVIGATIPGVPGVILGRNDEVAWSFTNNRADTQDLYLERLDPADPGRYLTPSGPEPFERVREVIRVKGAEPVELVVRSTRHGPVLSDADESARRLMPEGYVLSLAYAALLPGDQSIRFPLQVARARGVDDVLRAAETLSSPPQNVACADRHGAIALVAAGRVPRRPGEPGVVPLPGWLQQYDWQGFVPFAELPRTRDPESARLVTANQDLEPPGHAQRLGVDWAAPWRAERIARALDARPRHDAQSFAALQGDEYSARAEELVGSWLAALPPPAAARAEPVSAEPVSAEPGSARPAPATLVAAVARLRAWDFVMRRDAPEPLLYAEWLRELTHAVFADELGDTYADVVFDSGEQLTSRLLEPSSPWCDDVSTPAPEACGQVVRRAFERAVASLADRFGDDLDQWRWGDAHAAHFAHTPFGGLPLVGAWFDTVLGTGGGNDTVNLAEYLIGDTEAPLTARYGPSYRAIYDLADPEASSFIVGVGQSGNPLSPFYRNFAERWARGERVAMTTHRAELEPGALGTLVLEPQR